MTGQAFPTSPPKCRRKKQCRLHYGCASTTLMQWTPIYNGHGELVNQDPNLITQAVECDKCRGAWIERQQHGIKTWEAIPGGK